MLGQISLNWNFKYYKSNNYMSIVVLFLQLMICKIAVNTNIELDWYNKLKINMGIIFDILRTKC